MAQLNQSVPLQAMVDEVAEILLKQKATVSFAESCTTGQVSAAFGRRPGISQILRGAIVAYHNDVKRDVLGVSESFLRQYGAVSREVAMQMAEGAQRVLSTTYAVSVSGIAGPTGGSPDKPVGTVVFAVVGPGVAKSWQCRFAGDREQIQQQSVETAVDGLLAELRGFK